MSVSVHNLQNVKEALSWKLLDCISVIFDIMNIRILLFIIALLPLAGCPHTLIKQVKDLRPPQGYKPIYQVAEKSIDSVLKNSPFSAVKASLYDSLLTLLESGKMNPDSIMALPASSITASLIGIDDRSYPDSIHVKLSIKDERGHFVRGLAGPNRSKIISGKDSIWRMLIDSCAVNPKKTPRSQFSVREISEDIRKPIALSMVLDHSPSMGEMRARKLQEAVRTTMDILTDDDAIAVIKFTSKIHREIPLTSNYQTYTSQLKIDGLRGIQSSPISISFRIRSSKDTVEEEHYGGGTAIYDGALAGIDELKKTSNPRKVMIVFSDGGDNASKADQDSVIREARKQGVNIYTIAYGITDEEPMHDLAEQTGGKMYRIYSSKEFPFVLADIVKSMKNHYLISYAPPISSDIHGVYGIVSLRTDLTSSFHGFYDKTILHAWDAEGTMHSALIEFERGSSAIPSSANQVVLDVFNSLKAAPNMSIEIRGHTDDLGKEEDNEQLSISRAQSVAGALIAKGIAKSRLIITGKGESMPLVPNDSEESRKKNRRTEFIIRNK
ncbi:MAG: OmpA family protein [Ignavibacteria bacterium]